MLFKAWLLFTEEVGKQTEKMSQDIDYIIKAKEGDKDALNY